MYVSWREIEGQPIKTALLKAIAIIVAHSSEKKPGNQFLLKGECINHIAEILALWPDERMAGPLMHLNCDIGLLVCMDRDIVKILHDFEHSMREQSLDKSNLPSVSHFELR